MTHTTTRRATHRQAPRISSLPGNFEKPQPLWIYLYWIMLSSVDGELTPLVGVIIVLG
jgi:hypothetical protein